MIERYQRMCAAYERQQKKPPAKFQEISFSKDDATEVVFGQVIGALADLFDAISNDTPLMRKIVNEAGTSHNDETFVIANENGKGLHFDVVELLDQAEEQTDSCYYRFTTVGLDGIIFSGCVAWLDDESYKVFGVLNHVTVQISANLAQTDLTPYQDTLAESLSTLGYKLV